MTIIFTPVFLMSTIKSEIHELYSVYGEVHSIQGARALKVV